MNGLLIGQTKRVCSLAAGIVLLTDAGLQPSRAAEADWALPPPSVSGQSSAPSAVAPADANAVSNFLAAWAARAAQVRANQPAWSSPLVTTTGMLEQRFRFDGSEQPAGNGADTRVTDGGKGLDLIVSNSNEIQIAVPPYELRSSRPARARSPGSATGRSCGSSSSWRAAPQAATITSSPCGSRSRRRPALRR